MIIAPGNGALRVDGRQDDQPPLMFSIHRASVYPGFMWPSFLAVAPERTDRQCSRTSQYNNNLSVPAIRQGPLFPVNYPAFAGGGPALSERVRERYVRERA